MYVLALQTRHQSDMIESDKHLSSDIIPMFA